MGLSQEAGKVGGRTLVTRTAPWQVSLQQRPGVRAGAGLDVATAGKDLPAPPGCSVHLNSELGACKEGTGFCQPSRQPAEATLPGAEQGQRSVSLGLCDLLALPTQLSARPFQSSCRLPLQEKPLSRKL